MKKKLLPIMLVIVLLAGFAAAAEARFSGPDSPNLEQARELTESGNYPEAIEHYERYLSDNPEDTDTAERLAALYGWNGDYAESIALYRELLERYPERDDLRLGLARVLGWDRRYDSALAEVRRIMKPDPLGGNVTARTLEARLLFWSGDIASSLEILEDLAWKLPDNAEVRDLLVDVLEAEGRYAAAREYREQLRQIAPGMAAEHSLARLYAAELEASREIVSGGENWWQTALTLSYRPAFRTRAFVQGVKYRRFGMDDHQIAAGLEFPIGDYFNLRAQAGAGMEKNFIPGSRFNIESDFLPVRGTVLTGGIHYLDFKSENVSIYTAGITQYLPRLFALTYRYYYSDSDADVHNSTSLARVDLLAGERFRAAFGHARGGEAFRIFSEQELRDVSTDSWFSFLRLRITPSFEAGIQAAYYDRENSYNRTGMGASLLAEF